MLSFEEQHAPELRIDTYADAAREQLSQRSSIEPGPAALEAADAHKRFEERRKEALAIVELAEKVGQPVDPEIRKRAFTHSAQHSVDAILAARAESRRQALREASTPVVGTSDGSHIYFEDDPTGRALAAEAFLSSNEQVRRHREMAQRKDEKPQRRRRWWKP